ncbi:hypothetical protein A2U01_0042610, partial [Trifolium medium]|nr:hypothetical protein [Trifolium medium]
PRPASSSDTSPESFQVPDEAWRAISPGETLSRLARSRHSRPASLPLAWRASPDFGAQPRIWP